MFKVDVRIDGFGVIALDKKGLRKVLRQAGAEVARGARGLVTKAAGAGRLYYGMGGSAGEYRGASKPGGRPTGYRHRASEAGQGPARVTGTLAGKIKVKVFRSLDGVAIRDGAFYARFVDLGAEGGGVGTGKGKKKANGRAAARTSRVLAARPFLTRAMEQRAASIEVRLKRAIEQGVAFKEAKPSSRKR